MTDAVRRASSLVAACVVVLVLAACGPLGLPGGDSAAKPAQPGPATSVTTERRDPATDPALAQYYGQKPAWKGCTDGFECAKVTVPVDWAEPAGATLQLAVTRKTATGTRIGALMFNPGGPGASGVDYAPALYGQLPREVRKVYDVVSWDTRGVGQSQPAVTCLPNDQQDAFYAIDSTPDTVAEEEAWVAENKRYAAACQQHSGELLPHLDTLSTVKDMDVLRAVLGDQTLTFMGVSYGTYLGVWYAETFPWRVGRIVLDGVVDPSATAGQFAESQAKGFGRAVDSFIAHCLAEEACPLRGTRDQAVGQLEQLSRQIDAKALRTDGRPLTQALFLTGLLGGMYSTSLWPTVTQGLTEALSGDGTTMLLLADTYLRRDVDGRYEQILQVTSPIFCMDHADRRTVAQIKADAERMKQTAAPFGDLLGWGAVTCAEWPHDAVMPAKKLSASGAAPILVVGTTNDPATPYEDAVSVSKQLAAARLITLEGDGHTAYGNGNTCLDSAVNTYLLRGTLPAEGLRCS
ncbi:MAG: alpha/beta fold hydrolase [Kineosporiaceae bacterium]|nr:alpha/beta fold hydrolase [Kineosporiaceae bacterium]MBK7623861.1 alpha/beta fold hydrolase [Kineosporiaceae bacterium]MBK8075578.1 alpha/beta fold hydrolase [Kineosporiaceae bacterium]